MGTLSFKNGLIFTLSSLLIQNILYILAIFIITVSGNKFCKYIIKNRKDGNFKFELIKYIFFTIMSILIIILATFIESYVSTNLIMFFKKYL